MRLRKRHALFGLALGLAPLVVGCGSAAEPGGTSAPPAAAEAHPSFTGEDIFRGTMFGTGPVAELLPEIWKRPELQQAATRAKSAEFQPALEAKIDEALETAASDEPEIPATTMGKFKKLMDAAAKVPVDQRGSATPAIQAKMQRLLMTVIRKDDPSFFARYGAQMQSGNQLRIDTAIHEATKKLVEAITRVAPGKGIEDGCGACGSCGGASCGQGTGQGSCGQGGQGSCGQGTGQGSCGQGTGTGQGSCGQGTGTGTGTGQGSCGQGTGQSSCGQGAVGGSGSSNWYYNVNYVYTINWGAISNAVAGVSAVVAGVAAVIILGFFWDPTDDKGKDTSGLAQDHTLQRQMVVNTIAERLHASLGG